MARGEEGERVRKRKREKKVLSYGKMEEGKRKTDMGRKTERIVNTGAQ